MSKIMNFFKRPRNISLLKRAGVITLKIIAVPVTIVATAGLTLAGYGLIKSIGIF